ncbi:MAG TPA: PH domain-containing protein [Jatrophihabitans sp.]|uniref:PH domain-containing protein n=1 Tax=Jatrophihabitans sp. TaxID=1932789 RepID=UPI002DFC42CB|nr:PH domain-containing protein [Jatrophihabitans sp.]
MAYPEKLLANDEKVVEHLHPHWITLVPATLWFVVICAAAGVGIAYAPNSGTGQLVVVVLVIVVGLFLLSWLAFSPWIRWKTTHYVFTSHRVLIRRGVFRHTGRDISLQRISDVAFTQSLWDRMVKAGTLTIESAGEHGQETLEDIPRSDLMQQTLNRLIEEDSDRRARSAYGGGYPQQGPPQQGGYPQQGYPQTGQYPPTQQYPPNQPGYPPNQ